MAKQFEITTNKTTFRHFAKNKAEAQAMAEQIIAKFAVMYGDRIVKINNIAREMF